MAAYFWVGGTGTWSGTGNTQFAVTTGGAPTLLNPTNADTVTFDANSGTAATVTVTATAVSLDTTINKADITLLLSGSPTLCTGLCTLTAGTLNLNNFVLSTGRFNSSNANVRTITTGTGSFTVTGNGATVWSTGNATNLTYTTPIPTVNASYSGATGTRVFNISGITDRLNLNITAGTDVIAPVSTFTVNNYNFTGFSGTLTNVSSLIYGNLILSTGMTVSAGANTFEFRGTSGTSTITSNGKTMDFPLSFNSGSATYQLQDALTSGATRTITFNSGTLNLNNYTLTTGIFTTGTTNGKILTPGSGGIIITGNNTTVWNTSSSTGLTYTTIPAVNFRYSGSTGTRTVTTTIANRITAYFDEGTDNLILSPAFEDLSLVLFGGTLANSTRTVYRTLSLWPTVTTTAGSLVTTLSREIADTSGITCNGATINFPITIVGAGITDCIDALLMNSTSALTITGGTLNLAAGTTSTVGSFITTGTTAKFLGSTTPGAQATISDASGTNAVSYLTVKDSNATGGAVWDALAITNVDAGDNTGWLFGTTPGIGNEITMRLRSFTQPRRF